jgi:AcrR family transcriptional regulator
MAETPRRSLRAEHMLQTREALITSARALFGDQGYAATSIDQVVERAGVTSGALYHHFTTKAALFEAVFEREHEELLAASAGAAARSADPVEQLGMAFDSFLESVLRPDVQRIIVTDGPAVLGPQHYAELDERYAFGAIVHALESATAARTLVVDDVPTLARLLLGALTRGGMLVASSRTPRATRDTVSRTLRRLLDGLRPAPPT